VKSEIEKGNETASENAGVDSGNLTGKGKKKDVIGTCADRTWRDGLAAMRMRSEDATIPDGIRDLRGRDGRSACRLMSGGPVPLGCLGDGMLNRRTLDLGYEFNTEIGMHGCQVLSTESDIEHFGISYGSILDMTGYRVCRIWRLDRPGEIMTMNTYTPRSNEHLFLISYLALTFLILSPTTVSI
jgi:hypothetical protein